MSFQRLLGIAFLKAILPAATFAERTFNVVLAMALIVLGSPLFLLMGLLVYLSDGRPVLYRGERLGRGKKPFTIYKFRTLKRGAQGIIGGQLLSHEHDLAIRWGNFLRDTRLDELPQLFNILKGDINFIGPRPLRPEVYQTLCKDIPGFDVCFLVKPGLLGYSQIFTPHASPKRLRSLIDYQSLKKKALPAGQLRIIGFTVLAVMEKIARRMVAFVREDLLRKKVLVRYRQKRKLARVTPRRVEAYLDLNGDGDFENAAQLIDIHDAACRVRSREPIAGSALQLKLQIRVSRRRLPWRSRRNHRRVRRAICLGQVRQARQGPGGWDYVISYQPVTPLSHYNIHQYFLARSLASPFRAEGGVA
jgi:lipopolysaccharide/colanic/teichoic acid biosynthesis glycosyltransferase